MTVRVSVVNDYSMVMAGVRAYLLPFRERVEVVDLGSRVRGSVDVDVALYDTFAAPPQRYRKMIDLVEDPAVGAVAVYSFHTSEQSVAESFAAGADGFLAKSLAAPELVEAIEAVGRGDRVTSLGESGDYAVAGQWPARDEGLTARESEILALIVQGLSNADIADSCYLSPNTVKTYIRSAYRKIGVTSRSQAAVWGAQHGMIPPG